MVVFWKEGSGRQPPPLSLENEGGGDAVAPNFSISDDLESATAQCTAPTRATRTPVCAWAQRCGFQVCSRRVVQVFCPFLPRRPRRHVADGKLKGMDYLLATQDHYTVETYFLDCLHAAAHHAMYLFAALLQFIASRRSTQFASLSCYLADCGISPELQLRVLRNARHALKVQSWNTPETSVDLFLFIPSQSGLRSIMRSTLLSSRSTILFRLYNGVNLSGVRHICHNAISQVSLSRDDDNTLFDCGFMYKRQSRRFRTFSTFFYVKMDSGS